MGRQALALEYDLSTHFRRGLELRDLVKKITHIDLQQVSPGEFTVMEREQALSLAIDEKLAGQAVKKNRVAIKPLPDRTLKLNGQNYRLPGNGHCDMALESIASVEHQSIWIIENYRCFDRLGAIELHELAALTEPLVVFRGDHVYQAGTVLSLIEKHPLPVWVMGDLDPKGLSIAQSYPNFAGVRPQYNVSNRALCAILINLMPKLIPSIT